MAPDGEVDVPVVEVQWDISGGVGEIPADEQAERVCVGSDGADVEELPGVVLDAGEKDEGGGGGVFGEGGADLLGGEEGEVGGEGLDGDEGGLGSEVVLAEL